MQAINILLYETKVAQGFESEDGSSISVDCTRAYYTEADSAADRMVTRVNEAIPNHLCGDTAAYVVAKQQTFITIGNEVCITLDLEVPTLVRSEIMDIRSILTSWYFACYCRYIYACMICHLCLCAHVLIFGVQK